MDLTVRRAIPNEASRIAEIKIAAWRHAYGHILPEHILAMDPVEETAQLRSILENRQNCFVAVLHGRVEGYISYGPSEVMKLPGESQIYSLYIHPDAHRKGLGRQLLGRVAAHYSELGKTRVIVCVFKENEEAVKFYRALGAEYVCDAIYTVDGVDYPDEVYIWRDLNKLIVRP